LDKRKRTEFIEGIGYFSVRHAAFPTGRADDRRDDHADRPTRLPVVTIEATGVDPPSRVDWQTQWHVIR